MHDPAIHDDLYRIDGIVRLKGRFHFEDPTPIHRKEEFVFIHRVFLIFVVVLIAGCASALILFAWEFYVGPAS